MLNQAVGLAIQRLAALLGGSWNPMRGMVTRQSVLRRHGSNQSYRYQATRRHGLRGFKRSEMDTVNDGFFAVFDRPPDALRSAERTRTALRELGLDSRFGVHSGECEHAARS